MSIELLKSISKQKAHKTCYKQGSILHYLGTNHLHCLHLASRPQIGVTTIDSSLNVPSVSATLPWSQCLLLSALVFLAATSLSCRDLA